MNTTPLAVGDFVTVDQYGSIEIFPLLNDYDVDGDTLSIDDYSYIGETGQTYAGPNGGIVYENDFGGSSPIEYIEYTLSDGNGGEDYGTVEIQINLANQTPVIDTYDQSTAENDVGDFGFLDAIDAEDGTDLTFTFAGPDGALFQLPDQQAKFSFISAPDFENPLDANGNNIYEITATVTDSGGLSASDSFVISVDDVQSELQPTEGDDVLTGSNLRDTLDLLGGNDRFYGKGGNDGIRGGDGADTIFGDEGSDQLSGGLGNDKLVGGVGADRLEGDEGNDIINGETGHDTLRGGDGIDRIYGGVGNDEIYGDDGDDILFGDDGNDTIYDFAGSNRIYAGEGNDYVSVTDLTATPAVNTIRGGGGNDTLLTLGVKARLFGDAGDDTLSSTEGNDLLVGGSGNDLLDADAGNDRLNGEAGSDTLDGGDGDDQMNGGTGDDTLNAGAGNDRMIGGDGSDELYGLEGNDTLFGGDGDDYLNGGDGDDRLDAGAGANFIDTGEGVDTIILDHFDGATTENDDFDFTQDKLIIRAFDGNSQTLIDSEAELFALNLDGLTVYDDTTSTHLEFNLDDGTSHVFTFHGVTQFDLG